MQEVEHRSTLTAMISEFLPRNADADLNVFKDLPISKRLFLLRKQYDFKQQSLLDVAKAQREILEKLNNEVQQLREKIKDDADVYKD